MQQKNLGHWLGVLVVAVVITMSVHPVSVGALVSETGGIDAERRTGAILASGASWLGSVDSAATLHVSPTGADSAGCGTAEAPCLTLQHTVNVAQSGDTILMAAGTYTYSEPPSDWLCNLFSAGANPVVCIVGKHLTLIGGYSAGSWSAPNPQANPTIIDGQQTYRGMVVISTQPTTPAASILLEGLTFQNCLAKGGTEGTHDAISGYGGGLFSANAPVIVRNSVFRNNRAVGGDADYTFGGSASGGGMTLQSLPAGYVSVLDRVTFEGNQAVGGTGRDRGGLAAGGGLEIEAATVDARSLTFTNNIAQGGSSSGLGTDPIHQYTADAMGGAIALRMYIDATFTHMVATGNKAIGGSSALKAGAGVGGVAYAEFTTMRVLDSHLEGNEALGGSSPNGWFGAGGAIGGFAFSLEMERSHVLENVARGGNGTAGPPGGGAGGGLYLVKGGTEERSFRLVNSVVARNEAAQGTGTTQAGGGGGGIWLEGVEGEILHSTIVDNRLGPAVFYGPALLLQQFASQQPVRTELHYSIVADHASVWPAINVQAGNVLNLNECLFAANTDNVWDVGSVEGQCTTADSAGFTGTEDYHLLGSSPAVGLATSSVESADLDHQPRPYGTWRDAGMDEYWPPGSFLAVYLPLAIR